MAFSPALVSHTSDTSSDVIASVLNEEGALDLIIAGGEGKVLSVALAMAAALSQLRAFIPATTSLTGGRARDCGRQCLSHRHSAREAG